MSSKEVLSSLRNERPLQIISPRKVSFSYKRNIQKTKTFFIDAGNQQKQKLLFVRGQYTQNFNNTGNCNSCGYKI